MRARTPSLIAAALCGAVAVAGARAGDDASSLRLEYRIYLGGLHVLSLSSALDGGRDGAYRMSVAARTDGLIGKLVEASYQAEAAGLTLGAEARPERYRGTSRDGDDAGSSVALTYMPESAPAVVFEPPDEAPDEPLPAEAVAATVDPVSAMLTLMRTLAASGRCDSEVRVFDGKRRYDLLARHAGEWTLRSSRQAPYAGPAVKCAVRIARVAGFRDGRLAERYPDELTIYLAPVVDGAPPVPVRVHGDNLFGALRMHLVNPQGAAPGAQAGLAGELSRE